VITGRALVNLSAVAFLAMIGVLLARSRQEESRTHNKVPLVWALLPALAGLLAYAHTLGFAFVFDDYTHLGNASMETASAMLQRALWRHPQGLDVFFRPIGYISYWLNFRWAEFSPTAWHAYGLLLHLLNVVLVFVLCRKLFASLLPPLTASLVFALHGAHVEAVCWPAAQFDLLATLFVLLALIFSVNRNAALVAVCAMLACLSKESAYALPLLIVCTAFFFPRQQRKPIFLNAGWSALGCLCVFSYRLWFMQGIGGYSTTPRLLGVLEAVLFRLWSFLFMPLNWSVMPSLWMALPLLVVVVVALLATVRTIPLAAALAFTVCAALPVFAVLLIGFDMSKSRLLYLPSVGVCLVWAVVAEGSRRASLLAAALACFQMAALWHNQQIWGQTAELARRTCFDAADYLRRNPSARMFPEGVPEVINGVYFLRDRLFWCVVIAGGAGKDRVMEGPLITAPSQPDDHVFTWNDKTRTLDETHRK
jgi:hypothetical protein